VTAPLKTMQFTIERTIPAAPGEVFDAWLDPKNPCNPWHDAAKLIHDPRVDGLFYFTHLMGDGTAIPHFGRFTVLDRAATIAHTWMSPYTRGLESVVTVTLRANGGDTLLSLTHANLPDDDWGSMHQDGWGGYVQKLSAQFPPRP